MGYSIQSKVGDLEEITVNEYDEHIYVSTSNLKMFDEYAAGFSEIEKLAEDTDKRLKEIELKYKGEQVLDRISEEAKEHLNFANRSIEVIDGIFGEDTVKKYLRKFYNAIPDFVPDEDCILDFFEQITPVMEKIFDRHIKNRETRRKQAMAKYQPRSKK